MEVKAFELENSYQFVCTQETYEFKYEFVKQQPEGMLLKTYLQDCKATSIGLAEWEISQLEAAVAQPEEPQEILI